MFWQTRCRLPAVSARCTDKRRQECRRGTQECVRHNETGNLPNSAETEWHYDAQGGPTTNLRRSALAVICSAAWLAAVSCDSIPNYSAKTLSGEQFTSESLKGSVVLVEFWTTWCPYCRQDQPTIDAIERQYHSSGLMVLAVNVGEPREKVAQYLRQSPRRCRVVASEDTNLAAVLGSSGFPSYVLIGRDGRIAGRQSGSGGEESLRRLLTKAGIAGSP